MKLYTACPGEEVIFTCTVRGPSSLSDLVLAWSSTEYIGQADSMIQLSTADIMLGTVERSIMNGSTIATATVTKNILMSVENFYLRLHCVLLLLRLLQ